jgi:hypothetical protein
MEFNRKMKEACELKTNLMFQDKKTFEALPGYYKTGLHCHEAFKNLRNQPFELKKKAHLVWKISAMKLFEEGKFDDSEYRLEKVRKESLRLVDCGFQVYREREPKLAKRRHKR